MDDNRNMDFVARHYRKGAFAVRPALSRMGMLRRWRWTPVKVAAVSAFAVVMTATAAIMINKVYFASPAEDVPHAVPVPAAVSVPGALDMSRVMVIDFDDASLAQVVSEIGEVYGVEIEGLPDDMDSYRLTLHFEGNVKELVECINEILGTKMRIRES